MTIMQRLGKQVLVLLGGLLLMLPAMATESVTYYHNDVAGTPMLATDAAGNLLWKETYLPYGKKQTNEPASAENRIGYAGKPYDTASGLSYMGARYYDPLTGRFTGVDPKGFDQANLQSFNRYAYANNNPYKFVDPDGRVGVAAVALAIVGIGLVAYDMLSMPTPPANAPDAIYPSVGPLDVLGAAASLRSLIATAENMAVKEAPLLLKGPAALETTPGGRTLTEHALERMTTPPAGRAAMSATEVDQVLDGATNIRKMSPHPLGDTLTVQNKNLPGAPQVVIDAATGNRVITVINPKIRD